MLICRYCYMTNVVTVTRDFKAELLKQGRNLFSMESQWGQSVHGKCDGSQVLNPRLLSWISARPKTLHSFTKPRVAQNLSHILAVSWWRRKEGESTNTHRVDQNVVRWPCLSARATRAQGSQEFCYGHRGQSTSLNTQIPMNTLVPIRYHTHSLCKEHNPSPHPVTAGITVFRNHSHLLPYQWKEMPI